MQYNRCIVYRNCYITYNVLDIDWGLTVYEWEKGKDGCLGPTAAWCWGTDSPRRHIAPFMPNTQKHWSEARSSPLHQRGSGQHRFQQCSVNTKIWQKKTHSFLRKTWAIREDKVQHLTNASLKISWYKLFRVRYGKGFRLEISCSVLS